MTLWRYFAASAALALLWVRPAAAGSFAVAPIRVEFHGIEKTAVLTVRNETDADTLIQLKPVVWSQSGGVDQFGDTKDLLVTPPIFKLPAKGEQIIRVALRRGADPARELSYRLFIQEVPQSASLVKGQLTVALRISLPVFVATTAKSPGSLQWQASWLSDGQLQLTASNAGNAHVQVTDFSLQFGAGASANGSNASHYVLPGSSSQWTLPAPEGVEHDAVITVHGHSDQGDFSARVARTAS
jgi:fimbrial chaperone protein